LSPPAFRQDGKVAILFRTFDALWWLTLSGVVFFTVSRHEPWADEAQGWLLARDLGWFKLIFSELRYEGHPGLWHTLLWIAIHVFHMPYGLQGYFGATFAVAGLGFLIFYGPFPRPLRYLIASSFYLVYQYAAIARSYDLLPLLAFLAAYFFRRAPRNILAFSVVLCLLTHLEAHGAVIALALVVGFAIKMRQRWPQLDLATKKQIVIGAAMFAVAWVLLLVILFPPRTLTVAASDASTFTVYQHFLKLLNGLAGSIYGNNWIAFGVLLLACVWCALRKGLLILLIAVGCNAFIYGFLRGTFQHQGLMLIALLSVLWSLWPTSTEVDEAARPFFLLHRALLTTLIAVFALQTFWSAIAISNDWRAAYSGAGETAAFLKAIGADKQGCNGYNYWAVAVQPYFDHNIFGNYGGPQAPAFFHNSESFFTNSADFMSFKKSHPTPPYVVVSLAKHYGEWGEANSCVDYMRKAGYDLIHASEGFTFFKNTTGEGQLYLVFARKSATANAGKP